MSRDVRLAGLWEYPFPLRSGEFAYLYMPPTIERSDVERLKSLLDSLVMPTEEDTHDGPA